MNNPLVSIIICTYNRSQLLSKTLESVFAQKYNPVEIIIIDDGSTDDTERILKSYGSKLFYYKKENEGIAKSRSFGGRVAKGEFIAFLDDDDIMPPDRITVLMNTLSIYPSAVFATGDIIIIDTKGNLTDHRWLPKGRYGEFEPVLFEDGYEAVMWPKIPAAPHTTIFRRIDGDKIGWFDKRFAISEDKDFFARLGRLGSVVYVPKVVSYYRQGHDSLTNNRILTSFKMLKLFEKHLNEVESINQRMIKRLHTRTLIELKKIDRFLNDGNTLPHTIPEKYAEKFLSNMNFYSQLKYYGYRYIKLPLRSMINALRRSSVSILTNI
jgi:glycosyltransferase involved in cell wall biosynthesis